MLRWRLAAGGTRLRGPMERSALCSDSAALLTRRACGKTRCVRCALCAQTVAASQFLKRAKARRPASCAARRAIGPRSRVPPAAQSPAVVVNHWRTHPLRGRHLLARPLLARHRCWKQRRAGVGPGAHLKRREAQGLRPRAQRASRTDSWRLFERSARRARSEFRHGAADRASQGSRSAAKAASAKRQGLRAPDFAATKGDHAPSKTGPARARPAQQDQALTFTTSRPRTLPARMSAPACTTPPMPISCVMASSFARSRSRAKRAQAA